MTRNKIYLTIIFFAIVCFSACNKKYVTDKYCSIPKDGWSFYDTLDFPFTIDNTDVSYSVYLNVIHSNDYKYKNLYLFTHIYNPDSTIFVDTIQLLLSDNYGNLLGKGVGETKEAKFLLVQNLKFLSEGDYSFKLVQGMRDEYIQGIEKVGFVILK